MRFVPLLVLSLVSSTAAAASPQGARRAVERAYADGSAHMPYEAKLGRTRILASYPKGGARGVDRDMAQPGVGRRDPVVPAPLLGLARGLVDDERLHRLPADDLRPADDLHRDDRDRHGEASPVHRPARAAHGPNAFAAPVALAPRGRAVVFESYQHEGPRSRILVTTDGKRSTPRTLRGTAPAIVKPPPAPPAPPMSAALRAELQAIWASATTRP